MYRRDLLKLSTLGFLSLLTPVKAQLSIGRAIGLPDDRAIFIKKMQKIWENPYFSVVISEYNQFCTFYLTDPEYSSGYPLVIFNPFQSIDSKPVVQKNEHLDITWPEGVHTGRGRAHFDGSYKGIMQRSLKDAPDLAAYSHYGSAVLVYDDKGNIICDPGKKKAIVKPPVGLSFVSKGHTAGVGILSASKDASVHVLLDRNLVDLMVVPFSDVEITYTVGYIPEERPELARELIGERNLMSYLLSGITVAGAAMAGLYMYSKQSKR